MINKQNFCKEDTNLTFPSNEIKTASTTLSFTDILGGWKVRWGFGRFNYTVEPGLYAVGNPGSASPVLVSANYKLTFDHLRKNLSGLDCWLLILDTKGVNVWCAAGKGTFGTEELIRRMEEVELSKIVTHSTLILPQLGAVGVDANEIKRRTPFSVVFGPIRAEDIKPFIASGNIATKEMRLVNFTFEDRLVLIPVELMPVAKISLPILGILFIFNQFVKKPFDQHDLMGYCGAVFSGSVLTPLLLPYIPGRAFAQKGWLIGTGVTFTLLCKSKRFSSGNGLLAMGQLLLFPALSSFLAMNFTGASTYTSPSGVKKEMKKALPTIIVTGVIGILLTFISRLSDRREV